MPDPTRHDSKVFFDCPNYLKIETFDKENSNADNVSDVTPGACPGLRSGKPRGLCQKELVSYFIRERCRVLPGMTAKSFLIRPVSNPAWQQEFFVFQYCFNMKAGDKEVSKVDNLSNVTPGQTRGLSQSMLQLNRVNLDYPS